MTIGYGDVTPRTDMGKIAIACYAIFVVNVMAVLLEPAREYLERMCRIPTTPKTSEVSEPAAAVTEKGKKSKKKD